MTFQNAYHGVKKIFTSELLMLIGGVCLLIAGVLAVLTASSAAAGNSGGAAVSSLGMLLLFLASAILPIIGFIMNLVGLSQAGKDEDSFQKAFIIAIFAMIIRMVSSIFTTLNVGGGAADNIARAVSNVAEIIVFILVVNGVTNLADRLHKSELFGTANKLIVFYIIMYGLSIVANLILIHFELNTTTAVIAGVLEIVSAILALIAYIVYLVFLGKAKAMLREN